MAWAGDKESGAAKDAPPASGKGNTRPIAACESRTAWLLFETGSGETEAETADDAAREGESATDGDWSG
jgi:hypothetical protein